MMSGYAEAVEQKVWESREHPTAEQIYLSMKQDHPHIVLATVYNNLKTLCEHKRIRRLQIPGSPDRYDRMERHDHLVCTRCGAIADVTFTDLTQQLEGFLGTAIDSYDLQVRYLCPKCRAQH